MEHKPCTLQAILGNKAQILLNALPNATTKILSKNMRTASYHLYVKTPGKMSPKSNRFIGVHCIEYFYLFT